MAGGLVALLDDVAALARLAAASVDDVGAAAGRASAKAAGVVVDDTAVTPQYVHGVDAARELPIVKKIAIGSLRNKILFILPIALLLNEFADWLLPPLLILGGTYLAFEGAEKIWERFSPHHPAEDQPAAEQGPEQEAKLVAGAIRTDFILSTEIMVISLNEVKDEPFLTLAVILFLVAIAITILVYGVVALIVKMDDVGLHLTTKASAHVRRLGELMVKGMPYLLNAISTVGIVAMLWVGGHILLVNVGELGWHGPYELVHDAEHHVHDALGGVAGWLTNTAASAVVGLVVGALVVALLHLIPRRSQH